MNELVELVLNQIDNIVQEKKQKLPGRLYQMHMVNHYSFSSLCRI